MSDSIQHILEYNIFTIDEYSLSVYHVLKLLLLYLIAKAVLWLILKTLDKRYRNKNLDKGSKYALFQIIKYLIWLMVIVLSLETIGVKVTILIAGSAALLVGIGLGLQQTFNDIISGVILLVEGSIKVGNILDVSGEAVKVRRIGLRTSIVEDRNEIVIILPNSKIVNDQVINWSHNNKRARFIIKVGVAYGTDVDLVIKILIESALEHPECIKEKVPVARLIDFGESSLDFCLYFWSAEMFRIDQVKSDIRRNIVRKFHENGVTIPFPQRDLHFKNELDINKGNTKP